MRRCGMVDPVQYRRRVDDFDFDITVERFSFLLDAGRFAALLFLVAGGRRSTARTISPASPIRSIDALIEKIIAAKTRDGADDCLPRARPRHPRRPLLDPALVQADALDRLLGRVRPGPPRSRATPAACRKPGGTTPTKAARARSASWMTAADATVKTAN